MKIIHQVLGLWGFQWCIFHSCAFSKNSPNIQLMRFSLHIVKEFCGFLPDLKKARAKDLVYADFLATKQVLKVSAKQCNKPKILRSLINVSPDFIVLLSVGCSVADKLLFCSKSLERSPAVRGL